MKRGEKSEDSGEAEIERQKIANRERDKRFGERGILFFF
jgi:hypothetical protein